MNKNGWLPIRFFCSIWSLFLLQFFNGDIIKEIYELNLLSAIVILRFQRKN